MTKRKKVVKEVPVFAKIDENVATTEATGKTCNVFEQEMTWKIPNYNPKKAYSVSFLLPRAIECTLGLYPTQKTFWRSEIQHEIQHIVINPILFFNKIPNQRDHYKFKLKISQAAKNRGVFGTTFYETASLRSQGFNGYGSLITSDNYRNFIDRDGHLTLELNFILKEVEHCKPFDREDYTIERSVVAKDMTKLFMSEDFADITIILGEDKIQAHKMVLAAHSNAMAKMIEGNDTSELKINMRAPKEAYIELLRFIYNNTVKDLKKNLEYLLMLAKEFEVDGLRILCLMEINRAVRIKYGKFIGKNPKVPPTIMENDDKAIKFYKLLYDMDELFFDKKDYPTPSSSKSSLDEEQPTEQQAEVPIQDIQLPTIVLHPPPTFENDISDEIFSTSMTKFFVDVLSPIIEQDEEIIIASSEKGNEKGTATPTENEEISVEVDVVTSVEKERLEDAATSTEDEEISVEAEKEKPEVINSVVKEPEEVTVEQDDVSVKPTDNGEITPETEEKKTEGIGSVAKETEEVTVSQDKNKEQKQEVSIKPTENEEITVEADVVSSVEIKEEKYEVSTTPTKNEEIAVKIEEEKPEVISSIKTAETKGDKLEVIFSAEKSQAFEVDSETSEEEIAEEKQEISAEEKHRKPVEVPEVEIHKEIQMSTKVVTQANEEA